jgi:hypothetical protein
MNTASEHNTRVCLIISAEHANMTHCFLREVMGQMLLALTLCVI